MAESLHVLRATEDGWAIEAVLPGAQLREAGVFEVRRGVGTRAAIALQMLQGKKLGLSGRALKWHENKKWRGEAGAIFLREIGGGKGFSTASTLEVTGLAQLYAQGPVRQRETVRLAMR